MLEAGKNPAPDFFFVCVCPGRGGGYLQHRINLVHFEYQSESVSEGQTI